MKVKLLEKSEEHLWDEFLKLNPLSTIHQLSKWGHFQSQIPYRGKYWIVVLEENGKITNGTMLIRHSLKGPYTWLYASRGPLLAYNSPHLKEHFALLLSQIKHIAKEEKSVFLRIDPQINSAPQLPKFKFIPHHFQPQHTLIIDLATKETEILAQMKPKGRYNIKLAAKKGLKIEKSKNIDDFYSLLKDTTTRDNFHSHDKEYYAQMLSSLTTNAVLYLAYLKNEPIAGIIVTHFKDTATYYYGASSNSHRNLMAPYLLQWHAMKEAKAKGCKNYDLFGIAPPDSKNHPWQGVTEFKQKFGGTYTSYSPAQEIAFKKPLYLAYRLYKKLR
ncbi:MAG: peptidoglycan bridge formation glycyltransferase FemA/FemB family protein [Candidatus Peregrinibacteria bacterium]